MVWIVAKRVKTKRGQRLYHKVFFESWQEARVYQQDLFEQGEYRTLLEDKNGTA